MNQAAIPLVTRVWRRTAPPAIFALIYFGLLVYPVLRVLTLAFPDWQPTTPSLLFIMVGPIAGRLVYEWWPGQASRWIAGITLTWLGVSFIGFPWVLTFEIVNLAVSLPAQISGQVLLTLIGAVSGYALYNAQRLTVKTLPVSVPSSVVEAPGAAVRGLTFAQISDVHVGSRSGRFLNRVVKRVNEQGADYVLITGDLIDFRNVSQTELAALAELKAPTYFIIGNHERYVDLDAICQRLTNLGITVLRNASTTIGGVQLLGIDDADPKTQVGKVLPYLTPEPDRFRILLYHRPDGAQDAADWGAHLMLCGHTHNGQIVPFNYLVRRVFPRICGLYQVDALQLYVSPGTGTWGPTLRLGSRSEITLIRLT